MQSLTRTVAALLVVLAVAACGSSSSNSTSSGASSGAASSSSTSSTASSAPTTSAASAPSGPGAAQAAALGKAAAGREGSPVSLPHETIGLVNVTGQSEAAVRLVNAAKEATQKLGWTLLVQDAQGDPAKAESETAGFVNQHVNAILDLSNPTEAITQALAAAKAANIPVIDFGGIQDPSPNIEAGFYVDEHQFGAALGKYIASVVPKNSQIAIFTGSIFLAGQIRVAEIKSALQGSGIQVVATHETDFTNVGTDTMQAAKAILLAHPKLAAIVGSIDNQLPPTAQAIQAAGDCGKVKLFNVYDDMSNLAQIRSGCATAIVSSPVEPDAWASLDALAEMFARHTTLATGWTAVTPIYKVDMRNGSAIKVITKSNVPPAGQYVPPTINTAAFFDAKWAAEFGK